jgi:hypothetical protein
MKGKTRNDRLDYIQAMLLQLTQMARSERCEMAAYLIEMAYFEVSDILRGDRTFNGKDTPKKTAA